MTKKNKYYRTYIVEFKTSSGLKYYAGQRTSSYENPVDDPYTGSGRVITNAVKKYGKECIKSITWHEHGTKEEMNTAEVQLISECKQQYGSCCVNIHRGGEGGNPLEYATEEQKAEYSARNSAAQNRPEVKAKVSAAMKESWADPEVKAKRKEACARPEVKARRSVAQSAAQNRPEVKAKVSAASRAAQNRPEVKAKISAAKRTSPVWHGELYATLWDTWMSAGRPKYAKFQGYCKKHGITDLSLQNLVRHFNERYALEQPAPVPDNVVPIHQPNLMWLEDYTNTKAA